VRIGPGSFPTVGNAANNAGAWHAKSGMRLLGSGVNAATLKLLPTTGQSRFAIGMDFGSLANALIGFEASDFTIDCGSPTAANTSAAGVAVFGVHILLRRLHVVNFGGNIPGILSVINAASPQSEDCVLDQCTVDTPGTIGASTQCALFYFGGLSSNPHNACVVRNCLGRGSPLTGIPATPANIFGIVPGAGRGTILEGNQLLNLTSGVSDLGSAQSTLDLIIRDNYIRNVAKGIDFNRPAGAAAIGRIMAWNNIIEVATSTTNFGIALLSGSGTYSSIILRKNIIRDVNWASPTPPPEKINGIKYQTVTDVDIESNIIDNAPSGKRIDPGTPPKIFNNSTSSGVPVPP
jgi:hypothetical protein